MKANYDGFRCRIAQDCKWEGYDLGYYNRLTKSAHFIAIKATFSAERLAGIYVSQIIKLHGVPKTIISDRDGCLTSQLGQVFTQQGGRN